MQVFVKSLNNTFIINTNPSDTIETIKNKIKDKEAIPVKDQILVYNKILENRKTLSDYNIQNESTLELLLPLKSQPEKIKITLKYFCNTMQASFTRDAKIKDIKELIREKEPSSSSKDLALLFKGKRLKDYMKTISDYGINNDSIVYYYYPPKGPKKDFNSLLKNLTMIIDKLKLNFDKKPDPGEKNEIDDSKDDDEEDDNVV